MRKNYFFPLLFLLFSFLGFSQYDATTDRAALIALYNSTNGDNWTNSWDITAATDTWSGVTLDANDRVTNLSLYNNNLVGSLPEEIGNLSELTGLRLDNNSINGTIPSSIGNLTLLTSIDFNRNQISGSIPASIGNLSNLQIIYMNSNQLEGPIPTEIGNLSSIRWIQMYANNLSGELPASMGNLSNLVNLTLYSNNFTGTIPVEFGNLSNLEDLWLGGQLEGPLPEFLGNLTKLNVLYLYGNSFTGTIPSTWANLVNLRLLDLRLNSLSGSIPNFITNFSSLQVLRIGNNDFTGSVPIGLWSLPNLREVRLNSLTSLDNWSFPTEFFNATNLETFYGMNTNLTGTLPNGFSTTSSLKLFQVYDNNLEGQVPSSLFLIPTIETIGLALNNFSGLLPSSISSSLKNVDIYNNNFIFEDIVPVHSNYMSSVDTFRYSNQSKIDNERTITLNEGDRFEISVEGTNLASNTYQWNKGSQPNYGSNLPNETNKTFVIENVTPNDQYLFRCYVDNPDAPELTILTQDITLIVNTADDDNDGVTNFNDDCPNTPEGETVDARGCSSSQADDDNDGVTNNLDQCPNTPLEVTVNTQGCTVTDPNKANFLQNFSFENWSGNPQQPDGWTIENENGFSKITESTDGQYALELDLNDEIATYTQTRLSTFQVTPIKLQTETAYTVSLDYKVQLGNTISAYLEILKDDGTYTIQYLSEFVGLNDDGNWHRYTYDFQTDTADEDYVVELVFRARTAPTNIIRIDNVQILGEPIPDADNDGVPDADDLCPNTPVTALAVDATGCEVVIDDSNILKNPSFEDWTSGGLNISEWGRLLTGPYAQTTDISDNLQFSIQLTTGGSGNICGVFQDGIILYKDITYQFAVDYKVVSGTFNKVEFNLSDGVFNTFESLTTTNIQSGWSTHTATYTPTENIDLTLYLEAYSDLIDGEILFDNTSLLAIKKGDTFLDSDNDGVTNDVDQCPGTPEGYFVDNTGCPLTQTDTDEDGDGVYDADDLCPNTPTGETVDANGCSESQLDGDNDGVNNNQDQCPNSSPGATVDANGCSTNQVPEPDIPFDAIQVKVTSTTCPDRANGEISISFDKDYLYTVRITATLLDNTFDNINSSSGLIRSDLPADTYTVCVTIPTYPNFERCYTVQIETPEEFNSGKAVVDYTKKTGRLVVSGSKNYEVSVNDKTFNYAFNNTGINELAFDLTDGTNTIITRTDKNCQGEYQETFVLNSVMVSPNPTTSDEVHILGLLNADDATINISDSSGALLKSFNVKIQNASINLPIADLPSGLFHISIKSKEQEVQTKMIKR